MKKLKWMLWTAGILCLAGVLLCLICGTALGWNLGRLDLTPDFQQKVYTVPVSECREIQLNVSNYEVKLLPSEDADIHLFYGENDEVTCTVVRDEGKLLMEYKEKQSIRNLFQMFRGLKAWNNDIILRLPYGYAGIVSVKNSNGYVSAEDLQGDLNLDLQSANAGVRLEDLHCLRVSAETDNGRVDAEGLRAEQEILFHAQNGSLFLEAVWGGAMDLSAGNGKIQADECIAAGQAKLKTNNGNILLEQFFAANSLFETENGSVKCTVAGRKQDYQIMVTVKNGSSNLEDQMNPSAMNQMEIRAGNGSVRLGFAQNEAWIEDDD